MPSAPRASALPQLTLRALRTPEDYAQCVALQRETWGQDFTELVPASLLSVSQKVGGVAAGGFDAAGRLLGFVFGLSGIRSSKPTHWSHMLAVRSDVQGLGLGRRLKMHQRELLLERGIEIAYWTYDPLVARNAHLNLNRLGARVVEYVPDMYGQDTSSDLHSGIGTDRFVVEWRLTEPQLEHARFGAALVEHQYDPTAPEASVTADSANCSTLPLEPAVRIEIPADIQAVKDASAEEAMRWRETTRRLFQWYMARCYRVAGFSHNSQTERCFYLMRAERLGTADD